MHIDIDPFLKLTTPLFDVRSPAEFSQGHIPGAYSLPIFTNEERARVGTLYKQEGKETAILLGLDLVGPKLRSFVDQVKNIVGEEKNIRIYCWRGGMRSGSMGWLLETSGFSCSILSRGYKSFRNYALNLFKHTYVLKILDGLTGSGKTEKLHSLKLLGEQVIDLEALADHRGSSFGHICSLEQPTCEHFENLVAYELFQFNPKLPIWIENESRCIGKCAIPQDLWQQMRIAEKFWLESSNEERIHRLLQTYGKFPQQELIEASQRLSKKLGGVRTKQIIESIQSGNLESALVSLLDYYDRAYMHKPQHAKRNNYRDDRNQPEKETP